MAVAVWFRRDLRLADNQTIARANELARQSGEAGVMGVFLFDEALVRSLAQTARFRRLVGAVRALDDQLQGSLNVLFGDPVARLAAFVREHEVTTLLYSSDISPFANARDRRVDEALSALGVQVMRVDHPTLLPPGSIRTDEGQPYRVFTPYFRRWRLGVRTVRPVASHLMPFGPGIKDPLPRDLADQGIRVEGELSALAQWQSFRKSALSRYAAQRDLPALQGTSRLSWALHLGVLHPRTLLADLSETDEVFLSELCWRDFYAEVLMRNPTSTTEPLDRRFRWMVWDEGPRADDLFEAWKAGMTGYPIVDAGMRQLREEHWMHNRVRMLTASFLVKDLHIHWARGAAYFMEMLEDGDVASNTHGWQWVAGSGTDASPYFRIFNPIRQGERFDPDGDYVRRYVPELSDRIGKAAHQLNVEFAGDLFGATSGRALGEYPHPIVDHAQERAESLRRFDLMKREALRAEQ